jgi:tetratricopeptide (TPR) repeat protein
MYALAYVPHNYHFLWSALIQEGAGAESVEVSRQLIARLDPQAMRDPGLGALQLYATIPDFTWVRFGRWREILSAKEPDGDLLFPRAIRHWARGIALLRAGAIDAAEKENGLLALLAADPALEKITIWEINHADELARIAVQILSGEIALVRGEGDKARRHLEKAVELEDLLRYDEPPTWPLSARHHLGAALLELGSPGEAELVYLKDLERQPENGWSLFGLAQSLEKQERPKAAKEARDRYEKAFQRADVRIAASRF